MSSGPGTDTWIVLATTARVALAATVIAVPLGVGLGYVLARRAFVGRSVVETCVALPLVLPPTAIGYLLLALLARDGWLGSRALGFDPDVLFTWKAAVIASTVVALPLVTRTARAAFADVDPRHELLARSLGRSRLRTWFTVTLPLARRGLLAALALGFGRALGEFGATVIVAGNIPGRTQTLALAIFSDIQLGDTRGALQLVALTAAIAFGLVFWIEWLERRERRA